MAKRETEHFVPLSEPTEEQLTMLEREYLAQREDGTAQYFHDADSVLADLEREFK